MYVNTTHSPLILNNQLVEDDFIDPVDENRNHKSPQDETASEKINCTMCAVIIPNYIPDYFHGIEINPDCQNCSPKDLITYKQVSSFQDAVSISSSSQAASEATLTECSKISTIETNQGFPPTHNFPPSRPFPPIKPFPPNFQKVKRPLARLFYLIFSCECNSRHQFQFYYIKHKQLILTKWPFHFMLMLLASSSTSRAETSLFSFSLQASTPRLYWYLFHHPLLCSLLEHGD